MPAVQTSYPDVMQPGFPGMPASMTTYDADSLIVETVLGIGFGLAVSRGAAENGCIIGGANFVGVTYRDITQLPVTPVFDGYALGQTAGIMVRGDIWVSPMEAVLFTDIVHYISATGRFGKVGGVLVTNARWMKSGLINGLALLRIGMKQPQ